MTAAPKWNYIRDIKLAYDPLPGVFRQLCLARPSEFSLKALNSFEKGDFEQVVSLSIDPRAYSDSSTDTFLFDYAVASFFKKNSSLPTSYDRETTALIKWCESERVCKRINEKFREHWNAESNFSAFASEVIYLSKLKIQSTLGNFDLHFVRDNCRFGPGADLSTTGSSTSLYDKFSDDGSSTTYVRALCDIIFSEDARSNIIRSSSVSNASRLSFVPKTAKTHRSICVEPRWNVYVQLGIGELIARRLRRVGIDIRDQTRNQMLAQSAHADGLATIDLSGASDSISKNLVLELLPFEWSDAIFKSRSPRTAFRGVEVQLEKVSSMGNGYTFPLETLIFWAIGCSVRDILGRKGVVSVYGDDIIVEKEVALPMIEVLSEVGFSTNVEKTYIDGEFFESCGKDYFRGRNVRPIFTKDRVGTVSEAFTLCNQILQLAFRASQLEGVADGRLLKCWLEAVNSVPREFRLFGPIEAGDGCIASGFDRVRPQRAKRGFEGFELDALQFIPYKDHGSNYRGHLFSKLSANLHSGNNVSRRGVGVWKRRKVLISRFTDYTWL